MQDNNNVSIVSLEPWDCFRHILTSFSQEEGHGILTFLSNERLCIPVRDQEMALELQRHVGKLLTVMRTDDTEREFVYYAQDENHMYGKDDDRGLQVGAPEPDIVPSDPKPFDGTKDHGTTPSEICLVSAKIGKGKRSPYDGIVTKRDHKNNHRFITISQQAFVTDDCIGGETHQ